MAWLSDDLKRRIREEEWVRSWRRAAERCEIEGQLPRGPVLLLRRLEGPLMLAGGMLAGGFIGAAAVLLNFFLFNWILHFF